MVRYLDLLAKQIGAIVLTIKDQFHVMAAGSPIQNTLLAHGQSKVITNHGFI